MGDVVAFTARHARASICVPSEARASKVMLSTPRSEANLTSSAHRAGGIPRTLHPLTVDSQRPSRSASLPVPPRASMIDPDVVIPQAIVRRLRTCQEFAKGETTFSGGYGAIPGMTDPPEIVGQRLKTLRLALEFKSQTAFAKAIGVEKNTYNPWEKGTRALTFEGACKIRKRFNVPLDYLFFGDAIDELPAKIVRRISNAA